MNNRGINRRSFITTGSAVIAGLTVRPLLAQAAAAPPVISVGYWPRLRRMRAVSNPARIVGLYDAAAIPTTDPSFVRTGVRLAIDGIRRRGTDPLTVTADILHHADLVDEKVVFHAWSYKSTLRGTEITSSPVAFTAPMDIDRTLDLVIAVRTAAAETVRTIAFTVGSHDGAVRLNAGSYIIAFSDRSVDWSSLRLETEKITRADGSEPAFDFLIVSVSEPA
ncbi:MAG TPA: hypothetical protein VF057_11795 [Thermoanaerobaculia bacterium]